jgi:hypothetical protein
MELGASPIFVNCNEYNLRVYILAMLLQCLCGQSEHTGISYQLLLQFVMQKEYPKTKFLLELQNSARALMYGWWVLILL